MAKQNVYVGFRRGNCKSWKLLPFFSPRESSEASFTGETAKEETEEKIHALGSAEYERTLNWASDTWRAEGGRFGFALLTPFFRVPDPRHLKLEDQRFFLAPVVTSWIEYDNRDGTEPVELIFGIGDPSQPLRPFSDGSDDNLLIGFAGGREFGYASRPNQAAEMRQGFNIFSKKFRDHRGLHLLGGESALIFKVPAGKIKRFPLALGFYKEGIVTTGISGSYAYTKAFGDLEDVLVYGLATHSLYVRQAGVLDRRLSASSLDRDQRFLVAQATHSYYGSTQLLWGESGPIWIVNEGEYRMINTFDLTVDHLFFELDWHPWAVRDTLELFAGRYSYADEIRDGDSNLCIGGLSFTHDMGVMNHFTPPGRSSYECGDLDGCFSHMTMEQLLNWVLCATVYAERVRDLAWLRRHKQILLACAESLRRRDNPDPEKRNGILKFDSARCGRAGAEITTYDSLDISLGQARNNLYLSVKALAAWILLEKAFSHLKMRKPAIDAANTATTLALTLEDMFDEESGLFPAVFEDGNRSRILPAIEGLAYPLYLGYKEVRERNGRFDRLLRLLERHIERALQPGVCIDEITGAWKISSTSTNTWFSKIALAQYVIVQLYPLVLTPAARRADRIHADWQRRPGCGRDAMCDQINSTSGESCGSRYYPRGVTSYLWLLPAGSENIKSFRKCAVSTSENRNVR